MADPLIVSCPADTWTKIATGVKTGQVHKFKPLDAYVVRTYRDTGNPAPTDLSDAIDFDCKSLLISSATAIDVYLFPKKEALDVRVDL